MKIVLSLIVFVFFSFSYAQIKIPASDNVWIKTYQNYKNYNTIISNISKLEQKLKKTQSTKPEFEILTNRLNINRSKLNLYEKNKSFDNLLIKYKYELPEITLREYIFKNSYSTLEKLIAKYLTLKTQFYLARSTLENIYNETLLNNPTEKDLVQLKSDIEYFTEYSENIEKTHQNLLEGINEFHKKFDEYENEVLIKHVFTFGILILFYLLYKLLSFLFKNSHTNFQKFFSLAFFGVSVLFLLVRYIDDFLYIVTFLSVIAAALTIATREIILNIAGAIYIFFSNVVRVGDRVMVQFETKHTIGDIQNISMIKMKLQEVTDYTNLKEVKTVGRTIYIPNSYIFTKVFYNYSAKKDGLINDLLEFEFDVDNNFATIEEVVQNTLEKLQIEYTLNFTLNATKTAIIGILSYKTHYKEASSKRGELSISLLKEFTQNPTIKLKSGKKPLKSNEDEE